MELFGIYREPSHSPRRELDDSAILESVATLMERRLGVPVPLLTPEEFLATSDEHLKAARLVFYMCEEGPCLERLRALSRQGTMLINRIEGVENTFRQAMVQILAGLPFFPRSVMLSTGNGASPPSWNSGIWLKRGDYHALDAERDVVLVKDEKDLQQAMALFLKRGITRVLAQEHIPGDIVKFYCIRDHLSDQVLWFHWFYHKDQDLRGYPFSRKELEGYCIEAGRTMELEIFGGDAIVDGQGRIFVIDVNAWPSFALFRQEAAGHIASLMASRLT